jgi:TolB-like protein/class 3 adenylate cyclase/Tfp pilus assembly protein PilF
LADPDTDRHLAAILAADVVGYSRMIEADEAGTLAALRNRRKTILEPLVAQHRGRIVKLMGDGALLEFASAVNGLRCAVELQARMAEANTGLADNQRIDLRVGINLGEVVVEDGDVHGDGVNIAARLEALAEPGAILISAKVRDEVAGKIETTFEDLGDVALKNITRPVRIYRVLPGRGGVQPMTPSVAAMAPTIAVLPFTDMSADRDQQYFSDGLTEDIITELARIRSLTVIARHSTFQYRDKTADVKQIGRALGADYVVEGSVRKAGNRIRVTAQLIEAATGNHVWAEHYDRELEDIFAIQDELVRAIVARLPGRIIEAGARSAARKRPENLSAYDYMLRGIEYHWRYGQTNDARAREMFEKAIAMDPGLAPAYAWLSGQHMRQWYLGYSTDGIEKAFDLAKKAVALDSNDNMCHLGLGYVFLYRRQFDEARYHLERALALNPNEPNAAVILGWLLTYTGKPADALAWWERAFRLDPHPPVWYAATQGMAFYAAHRYAEAVDKLKNDTDIGLDLWVSIYLVASYGQLGRIAEAKDVIIKCEALNPASHCCTTLGTSPSSMRPISTI